MAVFKLIKPLMLAATAVFVFSACVQESTDNATTEPVNTLTAFTGFTVYKNPQCRCCELWIQHMEDSGFQLRAKNVDDLSGIKRGFGIQPSQQSCHTAVWQDGQTRYVFEGHIPAAIVQRFLQERPENAQGLLVPSMPVGSPGMEQGDWHMPYDVLLLKDDGSTEVYVHVDA